MLLQQLLRWLVAHEGVKLLSLPLPRAQGDKGDQGKAGRQGAKGHQVYAIPCEPSHVRHVTVAHAVGRSWPEGA